MLTTSRASRRAVRRAGSAVRPSCTHIARPTRLRPQLPLSLARVSHTPLRFCPADEEPTTFLLLIPPVSTRFPPSTSSPAIRTSMSLSSARTQRASTLASSTRWFRASSSRSRCVRVGEKLFRHLPLRFPPCVASAPAASGPHTAGCSAITRGCPCCRGCRGRCLPVWCQAAGRQTVCCCHSPQIAFAPMRLHRRRSEAPVRRGVAHTQPRSHNNMISHKADP